MKERGKPGRKPGSAKLAPYGLSRMTGDRNPGGAKFVREVDRAKAAAGPLDAIDKEVISAKRENRRVDLLTAFPEPPVRQKRKYTKQKVNSATGEVIGEPTTEILPPGAPELPPNDDGAEPDELWGRASDYASAPPSALAELNQIRNDAARLERRSPIYAREYKLRCLHRMILRNIPRHEQAFLLDLEPPELGEMTKELERRLATEAGRVDTMVFFGKTNAFYDEMVALSYQLAADPALRTHNRLQAIQTALAAESDRQRFYHLMGVFQKMPWTPDAAIAADRHHKGAEDLIAQLSAIAYQVEDELNATAMEVPEEPDAQG